MTTSPVTLSPDGLYTEFRRAELVGVLQAVEPVLAQVRRRGLSGAGERAVTPERADAGSAPATSDDNHRDGQEQRRRALSRRGAHSAGAAVTDRGDEVTQSKPPRARIHLATR